jgi:hypothetical protein
LHNNNHVKPGIRVTRSNTSLLDLTRNNNEAFFTSHFPSILSFEALSCYLNAVFPGLKMWDTFAFDCFDFKVRRRTAATNPGLHRQSNLKSPQTTCYCKNVIQLHRAIEVPAMCPRTQGYIKSHFSTLNVCLAGTGNRTQANCLVGIFARRSAIHYASIMEFVLKL